MTHSSEISSHDDCAAWLICADVHAVVIGTTPVKHREILARSLFLRYPCMKILKITAQEVLGMSLCLDARIFAKRAAPVGKEAFCEMRCKTRLEP